MGERGSVTCGSWCREVRVNGRDREEEKRVGKEKKFSIVDKRGVEKMAENKKEEKKHVLDIGHLPLCIHKGK